MSERPGIMFYFTMRTSLKRLSNEQKGLLFESMLEYGENAVVPDFDDDPALAIAWDFVRPAIDRDGEQYEQKKRQASYAAYCRESKKKGLVPLKFDDWLLSSDDGRDHQISDGIFDGRNHPITTSITSSSTTSDTKAFSCALRPLTQEQEFNSKRNEALKKLGAAWHD